MHRFFAVLSLLALLQACGTKNQVNEKTIIQAHKSQIPDELSPLTFTTIEKNEAFKYLHAFLLKEDNENNTLTPQVLKTIPKFLDTDTSYVFEINPSAQFDNGEAITAADIAFTLKAFACQGVTNALKGNFENFKRLEIVDKQKLKVVLSERLVQDLYLLTEYPILQQSVYDSLDLCANFTFEQLYLHYDSVKTQELETWCTKMNGNYFSTKIENIKGAGPYKLKIWENDRLVFERKSDHWTQSLSQWLNHSHAQEIVFRLNNDYNSKVLELKNQLVDVSIDFSSKELAELMTDTGITNYYNIHAEPAYSTTLMALNLKPELTNRSPIFTNKKVREAFANSLPVQDVIDKHSNGNAVRIASFVSINKAEYNSELSPYAYDIERAKALLKQAGWIDTDSDGVLDKLIDGKKVDLEVTIVFPPSPLVKTIITMLKEGIEKAGFRVVFENGQNWRNILFNTMEFDAAFFAITNSPGPNYAYSLVLTDAFRNGMNLSGYSNPKVDSIITLADQTFNKAKRDKFILELQKILYQDIPYIYITTGKKAVVVKKGFENVKTNGAHPMILLNTLKFKTNGAE